MTERNFVMLEMTLSESYPTFNLEKSVCNHGFFMMAPNNWISSSKTLQRPLRMSDSTSVTVSISSATNYNTNLLLIRIHGTQHLSSTDKDAILGQVRRMLRISEKDESDVVEFHKLHPEAKQSGFGRLFRSPTLFEDAVKSVLLCNCGWARTLQMAQALCELQHELANMAKHKGKRTRSGKIGLGGKHKRSSNTVSGNDHDESSKPLGNFPNPRELAALDKKLLEKRCNLGHRAQTIIQFAKHFQTDKLKLIKEFEEHGACNSKSYADFSTMLQKVKGFGPFVCANILMCSGFYERIPADSETVRHLLEYPRHERKDCNKKNVQTITTNIYGKYAPFQCLAYWWELLESYEEKFGRLSELPSCSYSFVSGYQHRNACHV